MGSLRSFLGRFVDLQLIGEHGLIQVYRGMDLHRSIPVLLKVVEDSGPGKNDREAAEASARICLEALATQKVNHPNVVRVVDSCTLPGSTAFVALEFLRGWDLAQHLKENGPMHLLDGLDMAIPICRAICAVHDAGIVHGDVKPANIILFTQFGPVLIDFCCSWAPSLSALRVPGKVYGTPGYMCREYQETGIPSPSSDVFSTGVTIYEMLSGVNPMAAEARGQVSDMFPRRRKGARKTPERLDKLYPEVPSALADIVHRAMSHEVHERPSMPELLSALEYHYSRFRSEEFEEADSVERDKSPTPVGVLPAIVRALDRQAAEQTPVVGMLTIARSADVATAHMRISSEDPSPVRPHPLHTNGSNPALARVVASYDAVTVPDLRARSRDAIAGDAELAAARADRFPTLTCGTMALRSVAFHASVPATLSDPETLPYGLPAAVTRAAEQLQTSAATCAENAPTPTTQDPQATSPTRSGEFSVIDQPQAVAARVPTEQDSPEANEGTRIVASGSPQPSTPKCKEACDETVYGKPARPRMPVRPVRPAFRRPQPAAATTSLPTNGGNPALTTARPDHFPTLTCGTTALRSVARVHPCEDETVYGIAAIGATRASLQTRSDDTGARRLQRPMGRRLAGGLAALAAGFGVLIGFSIQNRIAPSEVNAGYAKPPSAASCALETSAPQAPGEPSAMAAGNAVPVLISVTSAPSFASTAPAPAPGSVRTKPAHAHPGTGSFTSENLEMLPQVLDPPKRTVQPAASQTKSNVAIVDPWGR